MRDWICTHCGAARLEDPLTWRCACGGAWRLDFAAPRLDPRRLASRPADQWRYRELIPISNWHERVSLGEGMTPLVPAVHHKIPFLAKLDYLTPTGSFKDRGASVLMTFLAARGIHEVVEDSSGNAGAAVACYASRAGIRATIYAPAGASPAKARAITAFGAELVKIKGNRDDVTRAVHRVTRVKCYASHIWNPYFIHGTKTCAFEIAEQLGWRAPDWVIMPAGSGTMMLGLYHGFQALRAGGLIDQVPRLVAGQPRNCNPLDRFVGGRPRGGFRPTIAEGVAVRRPPRLEEMAEALRDSGGRVYSAREERLIPAMRESWKYGFYIEPTAALGLTALEDLAAREALEGRKVVVVFTGSGLKFSGKSSAAASSARRARKRT